MIRTTIVLLLLMSSVAANFAANFGWKDPCSKKDDGELCEYEDMSSGNHNNGQTGHGQTNGQTNGQTGHGQTGHGLNFQAPSPSSGGGGHNMGGWQDARKMLEGFTKSTVVILVE